MSINLTQTTDNYSARYCSNINASCLRAPSIETAKDVKKANCNSAADKYSCYVLLSLSRCQNSSNRTIDIRRIIHVSTLTSNRASACGIQVPLTPIARSSINVGKMSSLSFTGGSQNTSLNPKAVKSPIAFLISL